MRQGSKGFATVLWVGVVLGPLIGGIVIARTVSEGLDVLIADAPRRIIDSYSVVANFLMKWTIGLIIDWTVPPLLRDSILIWLVFSGTNLRVAYISDGSMGVAPVLRYFTQGHPSIRGVVRYPLLALLGPIGSAWFFFYQVGQFRRYTSSALSELSSRLFWRSPTYWVAYVKSLARASYARTWLSYGFGALLLLFALVANFAVAAALLWWSAPELGEL